MDIFDLIGPVMIGPSSSHTAGAARIGLTARMLLGEDVAAAEIGFHGSFAKTYRGHGTDRAVVAGLMGMAVDDPRMRNSLAIAAEKGLQLGFRTVSIRGAHPNTVRLALHGVDGHSLTLEAASVGGGAIRIRRLDGIAVDFSAQEHTLIIRHTDEPGIIAAVTGALALEGVNIGTMQVYRRNAHADALMVLELDTPPKAAAIARIHALPDIAGVTFLPRRSC